MKRKTVNFEGTIVEAFGLAYQFMTTNPNCYILEAPRVFVSEKGVCVVSIDVADITERLEVERKKGSEVVSEKI